MGQVELRVNSKLTDSFSHGYHTIINVSCKKTTKLYKLCECDEVVIFLTIIVHPITG